MKLKNSVFIKLFIMIIVVMFSVFFIQYIARSLLFRPVYINKVHTRTIDSINIIAEELEIGEDLIDLEFQYYLTDVYAYIISDDFEYPDFGDDRPDNTYEDMFIKSLDYEDGVYYEFYQGSWISNETLGIYYKDIGDGNYLVFETVLYGLNDANETLSQIDSYVISFIAVLLMPLVFWYSKRFTKPLVEMNKKVKLLSNLEFTQPLSIKRGDEIEELSNSINKVSNDLEDAIGKLKSDIEFEQYKDKKRRELIASLSHELKTPITTMRAVIEGMSDNVGRYQDRDKYLKESLDYLKYMEILSRDLIEAINIESKDMKTSVTSLREILLSSSRFTTKLITDKNHIYKETIEDCQIICNKDMISRVIINLINNASKYSTPHSTISIENRIKEDLVEIIVTNTNAHIDEEELTKIFEPFYRIEKSRSKETGGSGLGLFIIKTILDTHNSTYSFENTIDGVQFSFTLPKNI